MNGEKRQRDIHGCERRKKNRDIMLKEEKGNRRPISSMKL